jgi:flagellar basal-body rod protein FlgC
LQRAMGDQSKGVGVEVKGIVESDAPLQVEYAPHNPMADEEGYIYKPNVNIVEEMANMMSASKAYETNVQVADTTKKIFRRVLQLGQGQ